MKKVQFFVEGVSDARFIYAFCKHHFDLDLTFRGKSKSTKNLKPDIIELGSVTVLTTVAGFKNAKATLQEYVDNECDNIIILDADGETQEAGFNVREKQLEDILTQFNIDAKTFLWPNNADDGDLQTILLQIMLEQNVEVNNCWDTYCNCIDATNFNTHLPDEKAKVYAYVQALRGKAHAGDSKRDYADLDLWDLNHVSLNPFKDFLTSIFVAT